MANSGNCEEANLERVAGHLESPLDDTFGPLLAVLGKDAQARDGNERLSLQALLTRVRLKLQQISNAADPRKMTRALAQTVFQGKASTSVTPAPTAVCWPPAWVRSGAGWARRCSCSRWSRPGNGCCRRRRT